MAFGSDCECTAACFESYCMPGGAMLCVVWCMQLVRLLACASWKGAPVKVVCMAGAALLHTLCCYLDSQVVGTQCEAGGKVIAQ